MPVLQIVGFGDSLSEADENSINAAISEGGTGGWPELVADRLSNIPGVGPLISSGARFMSISAANAGAPEWSFSGSWTAVASTDAFDKLPYGDGKYSAAGTTAIATWTKPTQWRALHGVAVYFVDYASGDIWSYSTDGGSSWTDITVSLAKDNKLAKFYVTGNIASFKFRAANVATAAKGCFPAAIEAFYLAPSTANGLIWHNLARNGLLLNDLVAATSGDRMAFLDSVHALDATVITNRPNVGILMMHGRDVLLNNTATWNTDLGTLWTRGHSLAPMLWMNHFELAQYSDEPNSVSPGFPWATQTAYRDQLKTTAAAKSPAVPVFDQYDRYANMGFGVASGTTVTLTNSQNVALRAAGILNPLDNGHQTQAGHLDQANAVYWFVRNNLFDIGKAGNAFTVGSSSLGSTAVLGGQSEAIIPAGLAVSTVAGSPTLKASKTLVLTGAVCAVTAGTVALKASKTVTTTGHACAVTAGTTALKATNTLATTGKVVTTAAGAPTVLPGAVTRTTTGLVVAVTAGSPTLKATNSRTTSGLAVSVAAGSVSLKATNTLAPSGKAVTVTAGTVALAATHALAATGHAVAVTAGTPAIAAGGVTRTTTGLAVAVTTGSPSLHATNTRTTTGVPAAVTAGTVSLKATNGLATTGKSVTVTAGTVTVHSATNIATAGTVVTVAAGSAVLSVAGSLSPAGFACSTTAGAVSLHAVKTFATTGKVVSVAAGNTTTHATNTLATTGKAVTVSAGSLTWHATKSFTLAGHTTIITAGTPTVRSVDTFSPSGFAVTTTVGTATVRSSKTLTTTGKTVTVGYGTVTIASGAGVLHPTGKAVSTVVGSAVLTFAVTHDSEWTAGEPFCRWTAGSVEGRWEANTLSPSWSLATID